MYILDTNIVSELRKMKTGRADKGVVSSAAGVSPSELFVSAVTILELEIGILLMERRDAAQGARLRTWLETQVLPTFAERILAIDTAVAIRCAKLHVPDPSSDRDALIAATALTHRMTIVTRNVANFEASGVRTLNPWAD